MPHRPLNTLEPIHSSIFLLGLKIFCILVLTDIVYISLDISIFDVFQNTFSRDTNTALLFFHLFQSLIQLILVFLVLFHWLYHKYYIDSSQKHLFEQKGFLHTHETMIDLHNVRDVTLDQNILGQIFNYGNIILTVTASGGYVQKNIMHRIQNPKFYLDFLEECVVSEPH